MGEKIADLSYFMLVILLISSIMMAGYCQVCSLEYYWVFTDIFSLQQMKIIIHFFFLLRLHLICFQSVCTHAFLIVEDFFFNCGKQ